jgi:GT2 family glycosyltransferase
MKHEQIPDRYTHTGKSIPVEQALKRSLFVIPSINGAALLARMLPTLRVSGELVVVLDQGSTDETEEVCRDAGVECIQLGTPHTYTMACGIGARLARERKADYVFILNNDITFVTDVARELLAEMIMDSGLAIAAPSQAIIDLKDDRKYLAYRVRWDLSRMRFEHDFQAPNADVRRLEADFCELTCAVVRMQAIDEIGFLDDEYGFYHEDADFCFRLRQAGYACAYLPQAQIEHYHSSTFSGENSQRKRNYLLDNKSRFARKFLGYGVRHKDHKSAGSDSWNIINRNLHPYLHRFGLIDSERPELIFASRYGAVRLLVHCLGNDADSEGLVGVQGFLQRLLCPIQLGTAGIRIRRFPGCSLSAAWGGDRRLQSMGPRIPLLRREDLSLVLSQPVPQRSRCLAEGMEKVLSK